MSNFTAFEINKISVNRTWTLKKQVRGQIGNPVNAWAVAATIESFGIREVDAQNEYGFDSIFDLAETLYWDIKQDIRLEGITLPQAEKLQGAGAWQETMLFIKHYSHGLLFLLPMMSQIVSILLYRYSLWAWLDFNEAQATVVAFGTITAFIITGGFIQVMGRSVTQYIREGYFSLALKSTNNILLIAITGLAAAGLFFFLLNQLIPFYPQTMVALGLVYMMLIGLLLLGSGILYALQRRISILMIIMFGTLLVVYNMNELQMGIYQSQWIALVVTSLLLFGYGYFYLWIKISRRNERKEQYNLPIAEVRYYVNYRYFMYGALYFLFLFVDRILAWSAGSPSYIVWFNTPYELGMDWAILSLVFSIAVLEYSVHSFSKKILKLQQKGDFTQLEEYNTYFSRFYIKQLLVVLAVGIGSLLFAYYSVSSLAVFGNQIPEIRDFFANPMITKVFWIASISYLIMNIGLLHVLFFFTLNKPSYALNGIIWALIINIAVGYICSRVFALEYATLGLLAGAIAFAVITGISARRFFKNIDYYYYSAF